MRYTEYHLEQLLDMMAYPIYVSDLEKNYVYLNRRGAEVLQRSLGIKCIEEVKTKVIGCNKNEVWPFAWTKDISLATMRVYYEKKPLSKLISIEIQRVPQLMKTFLAPILDDEAEVNYMLEIYTTIYNQLFMRDALRRCYKPIGDFYDMEISKGERENGEEVIEKLVQKTFFESTYEYVALFMKQQPKGCFVCEYNKNFTQEFIMWNLRRLSEKGDLNEEKAQSIPVEMLEDKNLKRHLEDRNIQYIGCYPIQVGEWKMGYLVIGYTSCDVTYYQGEIGAINFCDQLAYCIKNVVLLKKLAKENEKRKEVEQERDIFLKLAVDPIIIFNEEGKIIRFNQICVEKLGYSEEELKEYQLSDLIVQENKIFINQYLIRHLEQGESATITAKMQCKDRTCRWISWSITNAEIDGKRIIIGSGRDITKQRYYEKQRLELEESLEKEKTKINVYSTLSHEFKTPLNIILSATRMLSAVNGLYQNKVFKIRQEAYMILKKVNDIIDLVKLDTGCYPFQFRIYNGIEIIEEITLSVAECVKQLGYTLMFDTEDEEACVLCDADSIERIMLNLLGEVLKRTSKEGCVWVIVQVKGNGLQIKISVNSNVKESIKFEKHIVNELLKTYKGNLRIRKEEGLEELLFVLPIVEERATSYIRNIEEVRLMNREKCKMELAQLM